MSVGPLTDPNLLKRDPNSPQIDMADYHIERLNDENAHRWDAFNAASPEGSPFHSLKWKQIVEKNSGSRSHDFLLFKNDEVVGLFPFIEHNIRFFRGLSPANDPQRLLPILKEPGDPLAMHSVIRELRTLNRGRNSISYILFQTLHEETLDTITEYPLIPLDNGLGDMVLHFSESSPEQIWNGLSKKRRYKIQTFDREEFELTEVQSLDDLEVFYRYYEENVRHIGAGLRPFSDFAELLDSMADAVRITLLSKGSLVAGGQLTLLDRPHKTAYGAYLSLNRDLPNKYSPSNYLYWESVNWAWENNFEKFSFGQQRLDENDPRYQVKYMLGGRFEPRHMVEIPLTRLFTSYVTFVRWRSDRQSAVSES